MRLLDRYLLRELLLPLGYCLSGFLIFWVSFDLISDLSTFRERNLGALEVAQYYFVRLPELLVVVLPFALLLALLYALTNHARHQELTAMRVAGVSLWRLSAPYFGVGLALSFLLFALNEIWVPDSAERAEQILERSAGNQPKKAGRKAANLVFHNARDRRNWSIKSYDLATHQMEQPRLEEVLPDGSRRQLFAQSGAWTNGQWVLYNVQEFYYPIVPAVTPVLGRMLALILGWSSYPALPDELPIPSQTNALVLAGFAETPEQIKSEIKVSNLSSFRAAKKVQLSIADHLNYRRLHPHLDSSYRAMLETQLHARLAQPWTCLVVVLIAIPFGAPSGRRNVFVGVASSIFIGFIYFVLLRLGLALGTGGIIPAWLAAWLPNLLFGSAGFFLIQRVR
jgi:lipopolysaccharide export system permease protein